MICPHCGARFQKVDAKFCPNCGEALGTGDPSDVATSSSGVKEGVNPAILIGVVIAAAVVLVAALVISLFVWDEPNATESATSSAEEATVLVTDTAEDTTEDNAEPTAETSDAGASNFVGQWRLESATIYGYDAKTVYTNQLHGKYVMLTLNEDGTGTLDKLGETVDVAWKMKNDKVGLYEGDGYSFEMRTTSNDGLVIRNNLDERMVFRKA